MSDALFPLVILAGGLGTRLRPVYENIPKSLVAIRGKPFIHHQMKLLQSVGFQQIVVCAGYLGEKIQSAIGTGEQYGLKIDYSFDGAKLLGTGGAIKKALPFLGDNFFVMYGDSYLVCPYLQIQKRYVAQKKLALMCVLENKNQWDKSNIEFANEEIIVYDKTVTKSTMHFIDYGLGIFSRSVFASNTMPQSFDLASVYQQLLQKKQLAAFQVSNRFYEIGSFAGIESFEYYLSQAELID